MSATTTRAGVARRLLPRRSAAPKSEPTLFRLFLAVTVVADLTILGVGLALSPGSLVDVGWELVPWILLVALAGLGSVTSHAGRQLSMDLPLLLAAGFLYGPLVGGTIAFFGYADLREFRNEVRVIHALFNRAQTSLSTMAAAVVFHLAGGHVGAWPLVVGVTLLALAADCAVNSSTVLLAIVLRDRPPLRGAFAQLRFGSGGTFFLSYGAFGLFGLLLAEVHTKLGVWGLAAFLVPVLLARPAFSRGHELEVVGEQLRERGKALAHLTDRMADERRDERLAVAAGLHDEILPSLYKVHLMGQVLRQDLATGRLLDLEDDLPELLDATEQASETTRTLIRNLRRSPIGTDGLVGTLQLLVRDLQSTSSCRIQLEAEEVGGSPVVQLLAYQVAREALGNAVRHSGAGRILIALTREGSDMRLVIEDDGHGFDPNSVDGERHFGLQLMRERVDLAGGLLYLESGLGKGTTIFVRLPAETSTPTN